MDIDQVNQMVAVLHYEIYNQARKEGKENVDAFRIADCLISDIKNRVGEAAFINIIANHSQVALER